MFSLVFSMLILAVTCAGEGSCLAQISDHLLMQSVPLHRVTSTALPEMRFVTQSSSHLNVSVCI